MVQVKKLTKGDFKVGDKIKETCRWNQLATITEITEKGFKYEYDEAQPFIPRWGLTFTGGECYQEGFHLWEILKESQLEFKY